MGREKVRGSSGVLRDMCRPESSVWAGNVLVEINRTAREAKGAMTCPPYVSCGVTAFVYVPEQIELLLIGRRRYLTIQRRMLG